MRENIDTFNYIILITSAHQMRQLRINRKPQTVAEDTYATYIQQTIHIKLRKKFRIHFKKNRQPSRNMHKSLKQTVKKEKQCVQVFTKHMKNCSAHYSSEK